MLNFSLRVSAYLFFYSLIYNSAYLLDAYLSFVNLSSGKRNERKSKEKQGGCSFQQKVQLRHSHESCLQKV